MREKMDEYLRLGQKEISQSGWVVNVLGPVYHKMRFVKGFELEKEGRFQEVSSEEAKSVIAGYPVEFLVALLEKRWPKGNFKGRELANRLKKVRLRLKRLEWKLTGESR